MDLNSVDRGAVTLETADHGKRRDHGILVEIILDHVPRSGIHHGIAQIAVAKLPAVEYLDGFVLGTGDQDPLVELDIQYRFAMRIAECLDFLAGGKPPYDNVRVRASGHYNIFLRVCVKLEAKHRAPMLLECANETAGLEIPYLQSTIPAAAD